MNILESFATEIFFFCVLEVDFCTFEIRFLCFGSAVTRLEQSSFKGNIFGIMLVLVFDMQIEYKVSKR